MNENQGEPDQVLALPVDDHLWRSCCTVVDSRVLQFMAQALLCTLVACFCMFMLTGTKECPDQQLYSGILTMVLGIFIPNPSIHK